ncbi:MAG: metallophosphoesterase family protein [Planctomycetota bacterium]
MLLSTLCLVALPAASPAPVQDVERGPYLQRATSYGMTIRWRTDWPTTGRVWYGTSLGSLQPSGSDGFDFNHRITINGLQPATKYYYAVGTSSSILVGGDANHYFVTSPLPGARVPTRVWVLGDSGTADANAAAVRDAYRSFTGNRHTDLWLMLGDNAYDSGTDDEFQDAVFDMYPEMLRTSPVWPTRGNHEIVGFVYYDIFSLPQGGEAGGVPSGTEAYYSFDHANAHFVCLDSFASSPLQGDAMATWLESDLASNDKDWTIAFWHHPPYSKGSHDSDVELPLVLMRTQIVPILEDHGVDLVMSGHSHSYERSYLIDGHYGFSNDFGPQHQIDGGDGREAGTGAYRKEPGPRGGAVYIVAGASGKISGGSLDHPAMAISTSTLSSVVLDIDGNRMDVTMLTSTGQVLDTLTMLQEPYEGTYCLPTPADVPCPGRIETSGTPSVGSGAPFYVDGVGTGPNRTGIYFFGFDHAQLPVGDSTICVGSGLTRTAATNSGGLMGCTGVLRFDFNDYLRTFSQPGAFVGREIFGQFWYREPDVAQGFATTDAVQFVVGP